MKPDPQPTPFQKFEDLLRRLSGVSKKEVDALEREEPRRVPSERPEDDAERARDRE